MFGRYAIASLGVATLVGSAGAATVVHATSHGTLTCLDQNASSLHLSNRQEAALDRGISQGWSEDRTTAAMHLGAARARAEDSIERNGCSGGDGGSGTDTGGGGSAGGGGGGNQAGGSGGSVISTGAASSEGAGSASTGSASSGGITGDNSPGSASGSPGSTVTNCTSGGSDQRGGVSAGLGNVCGIGVGNSLIHGNYINGLLTASGHSSGGLLNSTGNGATGGALSGLLDLGGLLGL